MRGSIPPSDMDEGKSPHHRHPNGSNPRRFTQLLRKDHWNYPECRHRVVSNPRRFTPKLKRMLQDVGIELWATPIGLQYFVHKFNIMWAPNCERPPSVYREMVTKHTKRLICSNSLLPRFLNCAIYIYIYIPVGTKGPESAQRRSIQHLGSRHQKGKSPYLAPRA